MSKAWPPILLLRLRRRVCLHHGRRRQQVTCARRAFLPPGALESPLPILLVRLRLQRALPTLQPTSLSERVLLAPPFQVWRGHEDQDVTQCDNHPKHPCTTTTEPWGWLHCPRRVRQLASGRRTPFVLFTMAVLEADARAGFGSKTPSTSSRNPPHHDEVCIVATPPKRLDSEPSQGVAWNVSRQIVVYGSSQPGTRETPHAPIERIRYLKHRTKP